jgi:hypothetical protein
MEAVCISKTKVNIDEITQYHIPVDSHDSYMAHNVQIQLYTYNLWAIWLRNQDQAVYVLTNCGKLKAVITGEKVCRAADFFNYYSHIHVLF